MITYQTEYITAVTIIAALSDCSVGNNRQQSGTVFLMYNAQHTFLSTNFGENYPYVYGARSKATIVNEDDITNLVNENMNCVIKHLQI